MLKSRKHVSESVCVCVYVTFTHFLFISSYLACDVENSSMNEEYRP